MRAKPSQIPKRWPKCCRNETKTIATHRRNSNGQQVLHVTDLANDPQASGAGEAQGGAEQKPFHTTKQYQCCINKLLSRGHCRCVHRVFCDDSGWFRYGSDSLHAA